MDCHRHLLSFPIEMDLFTEVVSWERMTTQVLLVYVLSALAMSCFEPPHDKTNNVVVCPAKLRSAWAFNCPDVFFVFFLFFFFFSLHELVVKYIRFSLVVIWQQSTAFKFVKNHIFRTNCSFLCCHSKCSFDYLDGKGHGPFARHICCNVEHINTL